jgi:hypothetical protein
VGESRPPAKRVVSALHALAALLSLLTDPEFHEDDEDASHCMGPDDSRRGGRPAHIVQAGTERKRSGWCEITGSFRSAAAIVRLD